MHVTIGSYHVSSIYRRTQARRTDTEPAALRTGSQNVDIKPIRQAVSRHHDVARAAQAFSPSAAGSTHVGSGFLPRLAITRPCRGSDCKGHHTSHTSATTPRGDASPPRPQRHPRRRTAAVAAIRKSYGSRSRRSPTAIGGRSSRTAVADGRGADGPATAATATAATATATTTASTARPRRRGGRRRRPGHGTPSSADDGVQDRARRTSCRAPDEPRARATGQERGGRGGGAGRRQATGSSAGSSTGRWSSQASRRTGGSLSRGPWAVGRGDHAATFLGRAIVLREPGAGAPASRGRGPRRGEAVAVAEVVAVAVPT